MADVAKDIRKIEKYVDRFHRSLPIFARQRATALIHLLRYSEDLVRLRSAAALLRGELTESFLSLRRSQDALVWAIRWIWDFCPSNSPASLELSVDVYSEAVNLFNAAHNYYELYRCFVLWSRGHFQADLDREKKVVRFSFNTSDVQDRDAARQLRQMGADIAYAPSHELKAYLATNVPFLYLEVSDWIVKLDEHSVECVLPKEVEGVFHRWAELHLAGSRADIPGAWQFGDYSVADFRQFWMGIVSACLQHGFVHTVADRSVGTKGAAVGSVVMHVSQDQLDRMGSVFLKDQTKRKSIIYDLTYRPREEHTYWDAI